MKTIQDITNLADALMKNGVDSLLAEGAVIQLFHLVSIEGPDIVMPIPSHVTNSPRLKWITGKAIAGAVQSGKFEAILMVSDTWFTQDLDAEGIRTKERCGWDLETCAQMGLCTISEAICVTVETPLFHRLTRQLYKRDLDGKPMLTGEIIYAPEADHIDGNFAGYWPHQAGGKKQ